MRIDRELLREILKSLKSGRLHKLLKLLLILAFFYSSFLAAQELFRFYLHEKKVSTFHVSGFHLSYNNGELVLSLNDLYLKRPDFSLTLYKCYARLKLLKTLKERKPYFKTLHVGEFNLKIKRERKTKKAQKKNVKNLNLNLSLPFYAEELQVEKFFFSSPTVNLMGNNLYYDLYSFRLDGIYGKVEGKELSVKSLKGRVENGFLTTDNLTVSFGEFRYTGKAKASKDLSKIYLDGTFKTKEWQFTGKANKEYSQFAIEGTLHYQKEKADLKLKGALERTINVNNGTVNYKNVQISFKGTVFPQLKIKGHVKGDLTFGKYTAKGISGDFNVKGEIKEPEVYTKIESKEVKTPQLTLKNVSVKGWAKGKNTWKLSVSSQHLSAEITGENEVLSGKVLLRKFATSLVKELKEIPKAVVSGKIDFRKEGNRFNYEGTLKIDNFSYERFTASGTLQFKGNEKKTEFKTTLRGKGKLEASGTVNFKNKTQQVAVYGEKIPTSSFTLLKKHGIEGKVSFNGNILGTFSNPTGNFTFSSNDFSYCSNYIGKVNGQLTFNRNQLKIQASDEKKDIVLNNLLITFKPFSVLVEGKVVNKPINYINNILKFYKVKLPVELSGTVSGSYSVNVGKDFVKVKANVESAFGSFAVEKIRGAFSSLSGGISVEGQKLTVNLNGKLNYAEIDGKGVSGGDFSLDIQNKKLNVTLKHSQITGFKNTDLDTKFSYDIAEKSLEGSFSLTGSIKKDNTAISGSAKGTFKGNVKNVAVKIAGKASLSNDLLKNPLKLSFSGNYQTGSQTGRFNVKSPRITATVNVNKNEIESFGTFKNFSIKTPQAILKIGIGTFNLSYPDLNGNVFIPAFEVKPQKFYRLFSVSGIYITLKNGKPEISGTKLSYIDGWIEIEKPAVKIGKKVQVSGKLNGNLGIKGLIYLSPVKNIFRYVKGTLNVKGNYQYDNSLSYSIIFSGKNINGKTAFLLEKFSIPDFKGKIKNGAVKNLDAEITVGDGNLIIKGADNLFDVYVSEIPVGEIALWKSVISGNLKINLLEKSVSGKLSLSKTRVELKEKKKEKSQNKSKQLEIPFKTNVKLTFIEPAVISTSIAKIDVLPQLNLEAINGMPIINGSFFVTDGKIDYMGKIFKVVYGSGVIKNLLKNEGQIDLLASCYISGYYVYMRIKGSFSHPKLILSSDPPLSKEQILNLVMTGASPEEIEKSSELFPAVQVAYYATASIFKPIETKLEKTLGLENFSVEPYITKYGETVAKFTISKRLFKRFRITGYETTGQKPEYGGSLQFFLNDKYFLETRYNSYYGIETGIGFDINVR